MEALEQRDIDAMRSASCATDKIDAYVHVTALNQNLESIRSTNKKKDGLRNLLAYELIQLILTAASIAAPCVSLRGDKNLFIIIDVASNLLCAGIAIAFYYSLGNYKKSVTYQHITSWLIPTMFATSTLMYAFRTKNSKTADIVSCDAIILMIGLILLATTIQGYRVGMKSHERDKDKHTAPQIFFLIVSCAAILLTQITAVQEIAKTISKSHTNSFTHEFFETLTTHGAMSNDDICMIIAMSLMFIMGTLRLCAWNTEYMHLNHKEWRSPISIASSHDAIDNTINIQMRSPIGKLRRNEHSDVLQDTECTAPLIHQEGVAIQ